MSENHAYSTFSRNKNDQLQEPMFFGQSVNVARYDQQKHPIFEKLTEKQLSFFWRPEEIDVSKDRIDYMGLPDHERHIFISNLKYQTLLDSVQGRAPNVAFLPIVSIPELEVWVTTWTFSECHVEGTEVLTDKGWKDLKDVTLEDKVADYNIENGEIYFRHPLEKHEHDYNGKVYLFQAKNPIQFQQCVTPGHRMPVLNRISGAKTNNHRFEYAKDHSYKSHHLAPVSGYIAGYKTHLSALDQLKIAVQADGSISERYTGERAGTVPVFFTFAKQRKIDRLEKICKELGFELIKSTYESINETTGNVKYNFKINVPVELKPSEWKKFTWVDLSSINTQWAEEFIQELGYWDGNIKEHQEESRFVVKLPKSIAYTSTIKENTDIIQAIASLCGYTARYKKREDDRKETFSDTHYLYLTKRYYKDGESIQKEVLDYKGKVRCLTMPSGAFVVRYNNVVSISGNCIHSRSYTHIIRNIVNDPGLIFDDIVTNEEIVKRATDISSYYDDLIIECQLYQIHGEGKWSVAGEDKPREVSLRRLKKLLYLCMMSVNVLEAIRFYVSFACSFAFAERKLMEGNAKIIKFIARDEALHLTGTQHIINLMQSGIDDPEFAEIAKECEQEAYDLFLSAANQEKAWAEYLFKDGSMIGLSKDILSQYIEYITNRRMASVNLKQPFPNAKENPIPWIDNWLVSDNVQVAPQETEISSYLVGQVDSQVEVSSLGDADDL